MPEPSAANAIAALIGRPAWALIRRSGASGPSEVVTLVAGEPDTVAKITDIPLESGPPADGRKLDRLAAIGYNQVRERGFEAHDDGTPLTVVDLDTELELPLADVIAALPDAEPQFSDRGGFETDDATYADTVKQIISDEIGQGEGANLVIARHYRARLDQWGHQAALAVYRRLLARERGAYWTYLFFTGERYLIGASPERHVSVTGGQVRMNPISGTFRVRRDPDHTETAGDLKPRLLDFLADEKEIYELFMVVDEELKMMCDLCSSGGQVLGPFLKPMTHLIHTEYLLAGRTDRDVREVLRDTMFAATVTGSPVENACRLIKKYEPHGRRYYAAALALFGRDAGGAPTADSPIVIRSADIDLEGNLTVTAGATLVRDSDPASEVAETHAKAGGILSAFGLAPAAAEPADDVAALARDEDVLLALNARNARLSTFWLTDQAGTRPDASLVGKRVVILDGEDDFVNMLTHVLNVMGLEVEVIRHEAYRRGCFGDADLVIVGPGPGDPRDDHDPKMQRVRAAVAECMEAGRAFLAVCLGHQALCHHLGIPLAYKDIVFQGTQSTVDVGTGPERVGFYNTFVGRPTADTALPPEVSVHVDPETGDVDSVVGPHYRGIQFHAESILTQRGFELLHGVVTEILAKASPAEGGNAYSKD